MPFTRLPANRICARPARLEPARTSPDNFAANLVTVVAEAVLLAEALVVDSAAGKNLPKSSNS